MGRFEGAAEEEDAKVSSLGGWHGELGRLWTWSGVMIRASRLSLQSRLQVETLGTAGYAGLGLWARGRGRRRVSESLAPPGGPFQNWSQSPLQSG